MSDTQFGKNESGAALISQKFMNDFMNSFNERLEAHLLKNLNVTQDELLSLGFKDPEKYAFAQRIATIIQRSREVCQR